MANFSGMTNRFVIFPLFLLFLLVGGWLGWQTIALPSSPPVLFLAWDETGVIQVFRLDAPGQQPKQLTQTARDVTGYKPSPDGRQIAFTTLNEKGETEIWLMAGNGRSPKLLHTCPHALCENLVWSPDNRRLVYEKRDLDTPGLPHLWWLDTQTEETIPLLTENTGISQGASFSADGQWLAYVVSPDEGIRLYNFKNGRHIQIPAEMGTPAIWHPQNHTILFRNHQLVVQHGADDGNHLEHQHDFTLGVYLFTATVTNTEAIALSGDGIVDDSSPAWSPDGTWIAFTRMKPRTEMGRQIWLMRADGSEAHPLTQNPEIHHGPPTWSPNGRFLLFQRFPLTTPQAQPSIWQLDTQTGELQQLTEVGFQPTWLANR